MTTTLRKLLALLFAFGLVAAACGGDDDTDTDTDTGAEDSGDDAEGDGEGGDAEGDDAEGDDAESEGEGDDAEGDDGDAMAGASLAGVCPTPLTLQTDWFPEAEHGAVYNMIGDDYVVDVANKTVTGTLVDGGAETDIEFQVRTGGPAIGFAPVASYVYTDDAIHLAYQNTEAQALAFNDAPMLSVVAPLEKNPQIIMWDPETYPDVTSIADLGTEGVTVNVFGGGVFSEVFAAQGILSEDQIDPSYDGSPARFIAEGGAIAQQGFASAEPYTYENVFDDWGKPVAFQLLHDSGFEVYSQTIAIRTADQEALHDCLVEIVPIIQRSVVEYAASPDRANAMIIDAVEQYADFWVYDAALADYSVQTQVELGLVGNGPNDTVGDMEADRIQGVIDLMTDSGMDVPQVVADDLFTNEYIDPSIGF